MDSNTSVSEIYRVFSGFAQPSQYVVVDGLYEPEREDYEKMLGGKARETIEAVDFGLVSWSPLLYLTADATGYLLPRLIEIAEEGQVDKHGDPFLMRFINYISIGPSAEQFSLLSFEQRRCIANYLEFISINYVEQVKRECWFDVLEEALTAWRGTYATASVHAV